jgi:hypothetical protein
MKLEEIKAEQLINELEQATNSLVKDELAVRCLIFTVQEIIKAIDWHEFEVPNKEINKWLTILQILRDKLK